MHAPFIITFSIYFMYLEWAVVVKLFDTIIANSTMAGPRVSVNHAGMAQLYS